VKMILGY
jgi:hypothetical protein